MRVRIDEVTTEPPDVRCVLVAQSMGFGERLGYVFAGLSSLTANKLLFPVERTLDATLPSIKCGFMDAHAEMSMYIETFEGKILERVMGARSVI